MTDAADLFGPAPRLQARAPGGSTDEPPAAATSRKRFNKRQGRPEMDDTRDAHLAAIMAAADQVERHAAGVDELASALRGLADLAAAPGHLAATVEVNRSDFAALLLMLSRGAQAPLAGLDGAARQLGALRH